MLNTTYLYTGTRTMGNETRHEGGAFRGINLMMRNRFLLQEQSQEPQFERDLQTVKKFYI